MLTEIKSLASKFLATRDQAHVTDARILLQDYQFESRAKLKAFLGISYFCGVNSSQKISKGEKLNYLTLVLYLSASRNAGIDICSHASTGCRAACLVFSGHALIEERSNKNTIAVSRCVKTWLTMFRRDLAELLIQSEIISASKKADRKGMEFAVRLNGTSDLDFSDVIAANPEIQFYDYSKVNTRPLFANYHLTFSFSTILRMQHYRDALAKGQRIAFPVADLDECLAIPGTYSMDTTDLRFLDSGEAKFGLLKVKMTSGMAEGIAKGFILTADTLKSIVGGLR